MPGQEAGPRGPCGDTVLDPEGDRAVMLGLLGSGRIASGSSGKAHPALKWLSPCYWDSLRKVIHPLTIGQAQLGDQRNHLSCREHLQSQIRLWLGNVEMQIRKVKRIPDSAYPPSVKRDN